MVDSNTVARQPDGRWRRHLLGKAIADRGDEPVRRYLYALLDPRIRTGSRRLMASHTSMPASTRLKIISGWSLKDDRRHDGHAARSDRSDHSAAFSPSTRSSLRSSLRIILSSKPRSAFRPPPAGCLFGTDNIGRDVFSLIICTVRSSLMTRLGGRIHPRRRNHRHCGGIFPQGPSRSC